MAHPFSKFRQSSVERSRVKGLTSDYAKGGAVKAMPAFLKGKSKAVARDMDDEAPAKRRADKPRRADGGRVKKPTTVVNVITSAPQQPQMPPPMFPPGAPPPAPPGPPPMPPGPPGGLPPEMMGGPPPGAGGPPPPMMRARGGRVPMPKPREGSAPQPSDLYSSGDVQRLEKQRASGGSVHKGTKVFNKSVEEAAVNHKSSGPREVVFKARGGTVSFKTKGPITSPAKGGMGPDMDAGAGSGEGRLEKSSRTKRNYHGPLA